MPDPNLESTVFPRGKEGLLGRGPVAPGPGEVPKVRDTSQEEAREAGENLERLGKALAPQLAAEQTARTVRAEARGAVREIMEEEQRRRDEEANLRKDRLRPFYGFMDSLRNLATSGPGGEGPEGRTELVLKLYRLVENGGPKPSRVFQTQVALSQEEALGLGDPDFEGRTMEWALQQGQFGRYEWRMLGWADGESILDTSCTVTVEAPANYQPPARPAVATEPEPKPDLMGQFRETLTLMGTMRDVLGLKGGSGMDAAQIEVIKTAAAAQARLEASSEHRRELRELEDRHRAELEAADRKGFERGKTEGERTLEAERLRWDLQRAQEAPNGPSFAQEVTAMLGGPQVMQELVGGVVAALNRPKPGPAHPHQAPPVRLAAPSRPPSANVRPLRPPVAQNPAPRPVIEPSRAEWHEAMQDLEASLDLLQELQEDATQAPEDRTKAEHLLTMLQPYHDRGLAEGSLAAWWAEWPQVEPILAQLLEMEAPEEEAHSKSGEHPMALDHETLKTLLLQRLDEGATDEAILAELHALVPAETMNLWRGMMRFASTSTVASMLGIPERHHARLENLLEALRK